MDKISQQANKLVQEGQFSSIEWQLLKGNALLSEGFVSSSPTTIAIESPIYRIYSMTKPIVSFVAMQLLGENALRLDDNIAQYLPAMKDLKVLQADGSLESINTPITIEHLLLHTAGFSYDFLPDCAVAELYREASLCERGDRSLEAMVELIASMPLAFQPGTQWRYSVSTDVLAHVLEKVTSKTLPELLNEYLIRPLDMHDTAFEVAVADADRLLPIFGARELGQVMAEAVEPNSLKNVLNVEASHPSKPGSGFYRGGHGLYSTLADYLKFAHVLKTGSSVDGQKLIADSAFAQLWNDRLPAELQPMVLGFNVLGGYGWNTIGRVMLDPSQCEFNTVVGEGGWAGAASTHFWVDPANDIIGIVMSQFIGSTPHLGALTQHAAYSMLDA